MSATRQLAAILFSDIASYTALMGKDEDKAFSLLNANRDLQKPLIEKYHGTWLKELGDGVMASFNSAYDAVRCAMEIQAGAREKLSAKLRIGIHLGDITMENNDVFGDGVNLASRIQGIADPGGVYVSESIEKAIRNRSDISLKFVGEANLKNVDYRVRVYAVQGEGFPFPGFKNKPNKSKKKKISFGLFLLVCLALAGWYVLFKMKGEQLKNPPIRSIAVLPFKNLTGSPDNDYIVSGIQDALITELSRIHSLRVISRTSSSKYVNSDKSSSQIAGELNVDAIVESSVMESKDSIRLNVQLIRAFPVESHLWAGFFDGSIRDILPLVSGITQEISGKIKVVLSPDEKNLITSRKEVDPEIYKLYLRGKYHLNKETPQEIRQGIEILNEVIEKDPVYAPAYATLAIGYGDLAHLPSAPQDAFPRAKAYAQKALELDHTLVEAHTALAESEMYYDWKFKTAENSFKYALAIDSNYAPAVDHYGWLLGFYGDDAGAVRYLRKAADLDPLFPVYRAWLAWYFWMQGNNESAVSEAKRVLEIAPDFPLANFILGSTYADMGKHEEAIALNKKASDRVPALKWALSAAYFKAGRKEEAHAILDSIEKIPPNAYSLVRIYQVFGDFDEAFKWLQVAYDTRHMFTPWLARVHTNEPIAKDPRFKKIMHTIIDSLPY